jgi:hypothetical protein
MSPADRTNQIVDEVCRKHFLSRERLLAAAYRSTSTTKHYRKVTHYARAELAWRLYHERKIPARIIADVMNWSKRSVFHLKELHDAELLISASLVRQAA